MVTGQNESLTFKFAEEFCSKAFQYVAKCSWAVDLTNTFRSSGACLKTIVALAAVASHSVDTAPVLTDARLGTAFIQVFQCRKEGIRECRERRGQYISDSSKYLPKSEINLLDRLKYFSSPIQPSPSGLRCMPGGQIHMKVPIRFLQVIPLESQSSRPSEHSSWSGQWETSNNYQAIKQCSSWV